MDLLPPELLVAVLRHLPLEQRLSPAGPALVCRAWHLACHSPDLIGDVDYSCHLSPGLLPCGRALALLASFAAFLRRHASAVRCLRLAVRCSSPRAISGEAKQQAAAMLQRCETACAAAGVLHTFELQWGSKLCLAMGSSAAGGFCLSGLHALQELTVQGSIAAPVSLPHSLSALTLGCSNLALHTALRLPPQLWGLPRLRSLALQGAAGPLLCADWGCMAQLAPTLQRLRVRNFDSLPTGLVAALASLTQLHLLQLIDLRAEGERGSAAAPDGRDLGAALGCLRQLSTLVVHNVLGSQLLYNLPPPAQLASLPHLRALHYAVYAGGDSPGGLPLGPWQPRLRWLAIEERLLHESRACIEGLEAVEQLRIKWYVYPDAFQAPHFRYFTASKWEWLWAWAERHAALHTLSFDMGIGEYEEVVGVHRGWETIEHRLRARRPELNFECCCSFSGTHEALAADWP